MVLKATQHRMCPLEPGVRGTRGRSKGPSPVLSTARKFGYDSEPTKMQEVSSAVVAEPGQGCPGTLGEKAFGGGRGDHLVKCS